MKALLITLLFFAGCHTTRLGDTLVGRWDMKKIVQDGSEDVTAQQNPESNRFIIFNADQTFVSGGDPYGRNTGRWVLDESTGELHIDSDVGEDDDSYWLVTIEDDRMIWQGTRFEFNSRFMIEHSRSAE